MKWIEWNDNKTTPAQQNEKNEKLNEQKIKTLDSFFGTSWKNSDLTIARKKNNAQTYRCYCEHCWSSCYCCRLVWVSDMFEANTFHDDCHCTRTRNEENKIMPFTQNVSFIFIILIILPLSLLFRSHFYIWTPNSHTEQNTKKKKKPVHLFLSFRTSSAYKTPYITW